MYLKYTGELFRWVVTTKQGNLRCRPQTLSNDICSFEVGESGCSLYILIFSQGFYLIVTRTWGHTKKDVHLLHNKKFHGELHNSLIGISYLPSKNNPACYNPTIERLLKKLYIYVLQRKTSSGQIWTSLQFQCPGNWGWRNNLGYVVKTHIRWTCGCYGFYYRATRSEPMGGTQTHTEHTWKDPFWKGQASPATWRASFRSGTCILWITLLL